MQWEMPCFHSHDGNKANTRETFCCTISFLCTLKPKVLVWDRDNLFIPHLQTELPTYLHICVYWFVDLTIWACHPCQPVHVYLQHFKLDNVFLFDTNHGCCNSNRTIPTTSEKATELTLLASSPSESSKISCWKYVNLQRYYLRGSVETSVLSQNSGSSHFCLNSPDIAGITHYGFILHPISPSNHPIPTYLGLNHLFQPYLANAAISEHNLLWRWIIYQEYLLTDWLLHRS